MKISIPTPCHESWENMLPADKGRFCNSCEQVVVDFSTMTSQEILHYFHTHRNEKVCGQFRSSQLKNEYVWAKPTPMIAWYKQAAAVLLFTIMSSGFSACYAQQTMGKPVIKSEQTVEKNTPIPTIDKQQAGKWAGFVRTPEGEPIEKAQIFIESLQLTILTNELGYFEIDRSKDMPADLVAMISKEGFEPTQLLLNHQNLNRKVSVKMREEIMLRGDIIIEE
jgi:hypothetical protein